MQSDNSIIALQPDSNILAVQLDYFSLVQTDHKFVTISWANIAKVQSRLGTPAVHQSNLTTIFQQCT
jgi:hypothetical protein